MELNIIFTPAENAVIKEQVNTLNATLREMLDEMEVSHPAHVAGKWAEAQAPIEYISSVIGRKISKAMHDEMRSRYEG